MEVNNLTFMKNFKGKALSMAFLLGFWILLFVSTNPLVENVDSLNPSMKPLAWLILFIGSFVFVFLIRKADEYMFLIICLVFGSYFLWVNKFHAAGPDFLRSVMVTVCYLVLGFLAVQRAVYYKSIFFMMLCFPTTLVEASRGTQFPLLIGSIFLFSSICWRYHFSSEEKLKFMDLMLLIVSSILIICSKDLAYIPILLQIFLIPGSAFSKKRHFWILLFGELLLIAGIWLLHKLTGNLWIFMPDTTSAEIIAENLSRVAATPLDTVSKILHDGIMKLVLNASGLHNTSAIGISAYMIWWGTVLGAIGCTDRYPYQENRKEYERIRRSFLAILFITIGLTGLSLIWNRYKFLSDASGMYNVGILPIYSVPLTGLALGVFSQLPVEHEIKNYDKKMVFCMMLAILNTAVGLLLHTF